MPESPKLDSCDTNLEESQKEVVEAEIIEEKTTCLCCEGDGIDIREGLLRLKIRATGGRLIVFDDDNPVADIPAKYCIECGRRLS